MGFYRTPGVYIEELPGPKMIEPIGTSTAAFLAQAPEPNAPFNTVVPVNNWTDFCNKFAPGTYPEGNNLANAVNGFFLNGGGRCYIVNVKNEDPLAPGLRLLETYDEISIIASPGRFDAISHIDVNAHCVKMRDRMCILDSPPKVDSVDALKNVETAPAPPKTTTKPKDAAGGPAPAPADKPPDGFRPQDSAYATFYYPWLEVADALTGKPNVDCPPSGHMAGIWASVKVHKAPANQIILGATGLAADVTADEQAILNPVGVNCIRNFYDFGITPWGARTLHRQEWRYINVRRLFIWIGQSILRNTRFVVFEPNDRTLWKTIKGILTGFLTAVWRDGALMGRTPDEAFFVKCDSETNTPETIDLGQVVAICGIAPVKPAEFVIFKIAQTHEGATAETL